MNDLDTIRARLATSARARTKGAGGDPNAIITAARRAERELVRTDVPSLCDEVERLREALRPFAEIAERHAAINGDHAWSRVTRIQTWIDAADINGARALLSVGCGDLGSLAEPLHVDAAAEPAIPPGPVNCNRVLQLGTKPYPRTCERCGLGPCPFYRPGLPLTLHSDPAPNPATGAGGGVG